jgi:hypothetical protein
LTHKGSLSARIGLVTFLRQLLKHRAQLRRLTLGETPLQLEHQLSLTVLPAGKKAKGGVPKGLANCLPGGFGL